MRNIKQVKQLMLLSAVFILLPVFSAQAQEEEAPATQAEAESLLAAQTDEEPLVFSVHPMRGVVEQKPDGSYEGYEIELMDSAAVIVGVDLKYLNRDKFNDVLSDVAQGKTTGGVAGITIKEGREDSLDFSYPTMRSGLAIMVNNKTEKPSIITKIASNLLTIEIGKVLFYLFLFIIFWGLLLWSAEKGTDKLKEQAGVIRDAFRQGYPDAIWCVWAQITTMGFGDFVPKTWRGRLLSIPIFFTGLVILGVITGPIVSAFTVRDIEVLESVINGQQDIRGKVVGTKAGTVAADVLDEKYGAIVRKFDDIADSYVELINGNIDAVVFDAPPLLDFAQKEGAGKVAIVGPIFEEQYYGIAFPQGSSWREPFSKALMALMERDSTDHIYNKWFGEDNK